QPEGAGRHADADGIADDRAAVGSRDVGGGHGQSDAGGSRARYRPVPTAPAPAGAARMSPLASRQPSERSHVTVVLAVRCTDGLVLGADSQITEKDRGMTFPAQKLHALGDHAAWGGSGARGVLGELAEALSTKAD